ncbi:sugar ABC transporter permease [Paenibacillus oenotherae]|uniref:Maltose/maltodextrin transport system permease protein n=1 Tax=Paenibacillus oenotherae TaxID=1435645 RepID=A0ABS7D397_9BACL|nr:sugar ABC transporter permease [Paenibacillus oenotherae]MBW7474360.1 sugar ABC transporter permease [Paenibacillus oenotherae]
MPNHAIRASLLSVLFMGFGQLYNRQVIKGLLLLLIGATGLTASILYLFDNIHGLITLGDQSRQLVKVGKVVKAVDGDHSIFMMVQGLISLLAFLGWLGIYLLNIRDSYIVGKRRVGGFKPNNFKQSVHHVLERNFAYVILFIPFIFALFLNILPLLFSILIAFTNYAAPVLPPANLLDWVGFETFKNLVTLKTWSRTFYGVFTWTIIWAVLSTATTFIGGILVAVLINQREIKLKRVWRTLLIIPFAIPNLVSLLVFRNLLNTEFGPINQYLSWFGLGQLPWLTDPMWARVTVIGVNMWLGIPVIMILVSGILTTIPRDMYESAEVDGATKWQLFRKITMPMVMFSTAPVLIMQFAGNINNFNVIFLLTDGNPLVSGYQYAGATDLLVTWLYKLTLTNRQYNFSAVIGIIIFVLVATLSIYNYRKTRSYREDDIIQ